MFEHFEAVEADFQAHYGLDLREVLWGEHPAGTRRVLALVRGLPASSVMTREAAFGGQEWSTTDELLATLIELTDFNNRLLFAANAKKGAHVWDPVSVPRPHRDKPQTQAPPEERKVATHDELVSFFGGAGAVQYVGEAEEVTNDG